MTSALEPPGTSLAKVADFDAQRWPLISSLFDTGADLPQAQRAAWLQRLHAENPEVAPQVAAMLALHEPQAWLDAGPKLPTQAWSALMQEGDLGGAAGGAAGGGAEGAARAGLGNAPPGAGAAEGAQGGLDGLDQHAPDEVVGRYRLRQFVAKGGMAQVWQAQAIEGPGQRWVALKMPLARHGANALSLAGAAGAARFAREGEILAALNHPHIARLYDAGVAEGGLPYLAMEWVQGQPLLAYCDDKRLALPARLNLFMQVLDAVAYAHAHLVIHRDLKPSNILVNEEGQVRLLDFGIAKMLAADQRAEETELTQSAGRVMTAAYAAPEQIRGETLTPAADVYALGVLLFELLTGSRPYRLKFQSPAQLEQAIEAADVQKASAQVAGLSGEAASLAAVARATTPGQHAKALQGDLDAVVGMALQREVKRRYFNAQALADDLRRHLDKRPVLAQPDTLAYSLRRLVARHRAAAAASLAALAALVLGLSASLWQAHRAEQARAMAEEQRQRAEQEKASAIKARFTSSAVNRFLENLLIESARSGKPVTVPEMLQRAETMARAELKSQPENLAQVLFIIGGHRSEVDSPAAGRPLLQEALRLSQDLESRQAIECEDASAQGKMGDMQQAMPRLAGIGQDPKASAYNRSVCLAYLADFQQDTGQVQAAIATTEQALAHWQASPERWPQAQVSLLTRLGSRYMGAGKIEQANASFEKALAVLKTLERERGMTGIGLRNQWGVANFIAGVPARSMQLYDQNLQVFEEDKKDGPPPAVFIFNSGNARLELGLYTQALATFSRAVQVADQNQDSGIRVRARCLAAVAATRSGDAAGAARWSQEAQGMPPPQGPMAALAKINCEQARIEQLLAQGGTAQAEQALAGVASTLALQVPWQPQLKLWFQELGARALLQLGRLDEARKEAEAVLAGARHLQANLPHSHRVGLALLTAAEVAAASGDGATAVQWAQQASTELAATVDATHPALVKAQAMAQAQAQAQATSQAPAQLAPKPSPSKP